MFNYILVVWNKKNGKSWVLNFADEYKREMMIKDIEKNKDLGWQKQIELK